MKLKDLEKQLKKAGWIKTEGGNHSKWTKDNQAVSVPRHREINEMLAKAIQKQAGLK
ncbi:MAG: type II toxin-antitoxin system HicA family toxin [bacterium]|nr:type II toxin-antitoxin system HicA family toxin [bacterium]